MVLRWQKPFTGIISKQENQHGPDINKTGTEKNDAEILKHALTA